MREVHNRSIPPLAEEGPSMTRPLAILLLSLTACFAQQSASPAITISPGDGPPTTAVTVSGSGFRANVALDIYVGKTRLALAITGAGGGFTGVSIAIPRTALPGKEFVAAVERDTEQPPRPLSSSRWIGPNSWAAAPEPASTHTRILWARAMSALSP